MWVRDDIGDIICEKFVVMCSGSSRRLCWLATCGIAWVQSRILAAEVWKAAAVGDQAPAAHYYAQREVELCGPTPPSP